MRQTTAVLCGYYGYGNGGDEALLATLLQMLPESVMPVVLSGDPATTTRLHGVESCDRNSLPTLLQQLSTADAFIWGGGSLIQDATSALSPVYYTALMAFAQRRGLKTIAWAQGIGPLNRGTTQWIAKQTFRGCTGVTVRDQNSAQILDGWRIKHLRAADPVWALAAQPTHLLQDLPPRRVAVSLREHPHLTPERLKTVGQALSQFQNRTQASIVFVPFQVSKDLDIAQTLQTYLSGPSKIIIETNPRVLKGIFKDVDLAICMRLHALIMAAAEGCRCFAVSYDPKVQQVIDDIQCPGWDLEALPTDVSIISQAWTTALEEGTGLSSDVIKTYIEEAKQHGDLLRQLF